jgi:hypothetical protein
MDIEFFSGFSGEGTSQASGLLGTQPTPLKLGKRKCQNWEF